ncbi:hypothetical protein GCM10010206_20720 [Streptomyces cinerochromogenes]|nr:hypothetical protein GCM10010206_20720 [Streptomyces cinerochromogenes]
MARCTDPMSVEVGVPVAGGPDRAAPDGGAERPAARGTPVTSAACGWPGTAGGAGRWTGGGQGRGGASGAWGTAGAVSTVAKGHSRSARGSPCGEEHGGVCVTHGAGPRGGFRTLTARHRAQMRSRRNFPPAREPALRHG